MTKPIILVFVAGLISACAVGPTYQGAPSRALPEQWSEQQQLSEEATQDWRNWWTRYEDPALTAVVERALADSLDLQLQTERIREARARLGLSSANRLPLLSAQASAAREEQSSASMAVPLVNFEPQSQYVLSGLLSYELDLWGRLDKQREAAAAMLQQSVFAADAVRLNLISDVVSTYFNLRAAEQQLELTLNTRDTRQQTLDLEEIRYEGGASDPLSLQQARASLAAAEARIPSLRQQVSLLQSALAVLAGYTPEELVGELDFGNTELMAIRLPDSIPMVMPSELLRRRPDIRAVESGLIASAAQVNVAVAERLPKVNLSGLLGSAALSTSQLFTAPAETWSVGADLAGPLFDFGRSRAAVASAEALRDQAETQYQITVLTAFQEVRDALTLYDNAGDRVEAVQRQVEVTTESLNLAELRYEEGAIGFYELLEFQRVLLDAQLALSDAYRDRFAATATLFKAMGGGWAVDQ